MTKLFKSKLGRAMAIIYLLMFLYGIVEGLVSLPEPMSGLAMLILSAPWSFVFIAMLESLGVTTKENYFILHGLIILGGLINALILYLAGSLFAKIWSFFHQKEKKTLLAKAAKTAPSLFTTGRTFWLTTTAAH